MPRTAPARRRRMLAGGFATLLVAACTSETPEQLVMVSVVDRDFEVVLGTLGDTTVTVVSGDPALDYFPRWSWSDEAVLYYSNRTGNDDVFVQNLDGGSALNLTGHPARDGFPTQGPDGRIVFVSDRDGDRDLWIMEADGSSVRQLVDNDHYDGAPTWSPDGLRIAYASSADGPADIWVVEVATGTARRLVGTDGHDDSPDWSPDGRSIAFNGASDDSVSIYVADADGQNLRRLPNRYADERHARWAPDGEHFYYTVTVPSDDGVDTDVWHMRVDGSDRQPVAVGPGRQELAIPRPLRGG